MYTLIAYRPEKVVRGPQRINYADVKVFLCDTSQQIIDQCVVLQAPIYDANNQVISAFHQETYEFTIIHQGITWTIFPDIVRVYDLTDFTVKQNTVTSIVEQHLKTVEHAAITAINRRVDVLHEARLIKEQRKQKRVQREAKQRTEAQERELLAQLKAKYPD